MSNNIPLDNVPEYSGVVDPEYNDLKGGYTFIASRNKRWAFYFKDDKLYDFDVFRQVRAGPNAGVFTFPKEPRNNYPVADIWKRDGTDPEYQVVKGTKAGYIYNPKSQLYFSQTSDGKINFTKEKPAPMQYYMGAWNDFIVNAKDYGEKVLNDSLKYFTQLYCGGPLGLNFDSPVPNDKCFCADGGSGGDGNWVMCESDRNNPKDFYQKEPDSRGCRVTTLCYRDEETNAPPFMSTVGRAFQGQGRGDFLGRGGAHADNSTFMFNGYDKNNKEKCINLNGDIRRSYPGPPFGGDPRKGGPLPLGENKFVNSMKCAISYDGMVVADWKLKSDAEKPETLATPVDGFESIKPAISGESMKDKTGNRDIKYETVKFGDNVLWFPFASGTANSQTIMEFCGSPDENGNIRRNGDSNHTGCRNWANDSEAKVDRYQNLSGRTPLEESKIYTCKRIREFMNSSNESDFDYCGKAEMCDTDQSGCKREMLEYCKEGDNFQKQVCRDFCINSKGTCDNDLSNYCTGKYRADKNILTTQGQSLDGRTSLKRACSCFYPPQAYQEFGAKASQYVTASGSNITLPSNPLQTVTNPACFFPSCTDTLSVKAANVNYNCPSIQQCFQITESKVGSSTVGNMNIQSNCTLAQATAAGLCQNPAYPDWDETEQKCVASGTASRGSVVPREYSGNVNSNTSGPGTRITGDDKGAPRAKCEGGQVISRSGEDCLFACPVGQVKNTATNQCVLNSELPVDENADGKNDMWLIGGIIGGIVLLLIIVIIIVVARR
jgi:hypothetical protein